MEERIQKSYQKYHANAFQTLLHLYQGNYWRFAMSGLFFIIKHLPSWLMPNRYCQCNQCSFIKRFLSIAGDLFQRFFDDLSDRTKYIDELFSCKIP